MTERHVFEILLKNEKNEDYAYDFPKLQKEAASIAADKFTEIIYETLKQKSVASHTKRGNVLKYLHSICKVKPFHLNGDSFECFLKPLGPKLIVNQVEEEISQFISDVQAELEEEAPISVTDQVIHFYKIKNARERERHRRLEIINKNIQEELNKKIDLHMKKTVPYYEITEDMIRELTGESVKRRSSIRVLNRVYTDEYREKQIKFCYALLNLNSHFVYVENILERLSTYKKLESFEINFLIYLWINEGEVTNFISTLSEKFPFIIERFLLKCATDIVKLKEDADVYQHFESLKNNQKLVKIKKICSENRILSLNMKSLIYELYCHSFCNENVLKLINFVQ